MPHGIGPRKLHALHVHCLFHGWQPERPLIFFPQTVRHKEKEVELSQEVFVEAMCSSDRPAFSLFDQRGEEYFHLYCAMGLPSQHSHVQILLARVGHVTFAAKFAAFVSRSTRCKYRRAQVQGEALASWDAFVGELRL